MRNAFIPPYKKLLLSALILCISSVVIAGAQTPSFVWAAAGVTGGSSGSFASAHMVTDNAGNSYVSGTFYTGYVVFGKDTLYNNVGSVSSLYIVKYDPQGHELWAIQTDSFERSGGSAIAINKNTGKLYVAVTFQENYNSSSVYIPGYLGPYGSTNTSGSIIAQLDAATGAVDWIKEMDSHIKVTALTVDGDSIVIGGSFKSTLTVPFGDGVTLITKSSYNLYDIFIAECDQSGKTLWAKQGYQPAGGSSEQAGVQSMTTDHNGNILILGDYQGALVIGSDSLVSAGNWMYTAKFDRAGNFIWATSNSSTNFNNGGYNVATKVVCDEANNVIITGQYFTTLIWGTDTLTNNSGNIGSFVVKYDPLGNVLWALDPGATCNVFSGGAAIATDKANNIYFTMTYEHPFTFDTFSLTPIVGMYNESRDVFVAKIDPSGQPLWLKTVGGNLDDYAGDIVIDSFQNIFITGYFASIDCRFDSIVLSSPSAGYSFFTAKIGPAANPDTVLFTASKQSICQNSSITFTDQSVGSPSNRVWTFTGGTPFTSTEQNPTVTYKDTGTFSVKLLSTFVSGKDSLIKAGYITVRALPVAGVITATAASICAGMVAELQDTGFSTGSLQWQSAVTVDDFAAINGAALSTYNSPVQQTTYYRVINSNGSCADTSSAFKLVVNAAPPLPVVNAADSIFCASDSTLLSTSITYSTYHWNNDDIHAHTFATYAGDYWVTITDANGCSAVSNHKYIAVYPAASVSITEKGDTLSSYGANSYQWYFNGVPVQGANGSVYIGQQTGNYALQVTDSNGCKTLSNDTYIITGLEAINTLTELVVYPNPANNVLNLRYSASSGKNISYDILNVIGEKIIRGTLLNGENTALDIAQFPRGIYLLQLHGEAETMTRKIMLQ